MASDVGHPGDGLIGRLAQVNIRRANAKFGLKKI
jgi:hypothetical protein